LKFKILPMDIMASSPFKDSLSNAVKSVKIGAKQTNSLVKAGIPVKDAVKIAYSANIASKFTALARKSGFGDTSGNKIVIVDEREESSDAGAGFIMLIVPLLAITILVFGFKSISILCPGGWEGNGIRWILLFLLFITGGNIGLVYIVMAYMLNMKICK